MPLGGDGVFAYLKSEEGAMGVGMGEGSAMGNPDHLRELLKGVEHWNAWREVQGVGFYPSLQNEPIADAFFLAGIISSEQSAPLRGCDLNSVDLSESDLSNADLREADLRGANLRHTVFQHANMLLTQVQTIWVAHGALSKSGSRDVGKTYRTDLSQVLFLDQDQLNAMIGDSETIIPDHLERTAHWPVF